MRSRRYRQGYWKAARGALAVGLVLSAAGCVNPFDLGKKSAAKPENEVKPDAVGIDVVTLGDGVRVVGSKLALRAARNEWVDGYLRLPEVGEKGGVLKVRPLKRAVGGEIKGVAAYRVESVGFDMRSVEAVRAVGAGAYGARLPRALVPLKEKEGGKEGGEAGTFEVPAGTGLVYVEMKPTVDNEAGEYVGEIELAPVEGEGKWSVPVAVQVDDLTLSDAPAFAFYGEMTWGDLVRIWPGQFGKVGARLLSRTDAGQVVAVEKLDEMVRLARENRVSVGVKELGPRVKNTPREGVRVDWSDYDSVVLPWLKGETDQAGEGLTAFPLPAAREGGGNAGLSEKEYWALVVSHFDQERVLGRMIAGPEVAADALPSLAEGRVRRVEVGMESLPVSVEAYRQAAWTALATGKTAAKAGPAAPGAGGVSEVSEAGMPGWFYPGEWFGHAGEVPGVVPGVALKWARRAQQDYELLDLARRRGAKALSVGIAGQITRVGQKRGEPGEDLLTPAVEPASWEEALRLAREAALARVPGASEPTEEERARLAELEDTALLRWSVILQRPIALPVGVTYAAADEAGRLPFTVELALPEAGSEVGVENVPKAWEGTGVALREGGATLRGTIELEKLFPPYRDRLVAEVTSGPERLRSKREMVVPAVHVLPAAKAPVLDGQLGDWGEDELILTKAEGELAEQSGLVRMLNRRSVQMSTLTRSPKPAKAYARWEAGALWVAIRFDGVSAENLAATNFTREEQGRACGEDLCRMVLKRVGAGRDQEVRLLVKPSGVTVEKGELPGERVLYASGVKDGVWRAEMRIPAALLGSELKDGTQLEFQLVRHDGETGESASWAGPVDRDYEGLRGLLLIVERMPKGG